MSAFPTETPACVAACGFTPSCSPVSSGSHIELKPAQFHLPQHGRADVLWQSLEDTSPEKESHSCSAQLPKSPLLSLSLFSFFFSFFFKFALLYLRFFSPNRLTEERMLRGREGWNGKRLAKRSSVSETPARCSSGAEPAIAL